MLPAATLDAPWSYTFSAVGGTPPYQWQYDPNFRVTLPPGLSLNSATGTLSGTPTGSIVGGFAVQIQVTDQAGTSASQVFTFSLADRITVSYDWYFSWTVGSRYSSPATASGGVPPFRWSVTGGALPDGLTLDVTTGLVSGTPTRAGVFNFILQATDVNTAFGSKGVTLTINPPITITTPSPLPDGIAGTAYSFQFSGSGGTVPLHFEPKANLPSGLSLSDAGVLSGTPLVPGVFTVSLLIVDTASTSTSKNFSLTVRSPTSLSVLTASPLPGGTVGALYSQAFTVLVGTPPYTWSVAGGATPPGLSLSSSGVLSGTPSTYGTFTFTVGVSDASSANATKSFVLVISPAPLTITTTSLPNPVVNKPYSTTLAASGGAPPYQWFISPASLPGGLVLDTPTGTISGTVAWPNTWNFGVIVTDSMGARAYQTYRMQIFSVLGFFPIAPCRIVDTRSYGGKTGLFGPPSLAGGVSRDFPLISGGCGIPNDVEAYSLNVTVFPHRPLGFLSVWPAYAPFPVVSTLNSFDGAVVANAAIVPAGYNGVISAYASDDTDVFIDVNGYFAPPNGRGLAFYPVPPCRVADTRSYGGKSGAFGPPTLAAWSTRDFPVPSSSCGIPSSAQAYSLNMTAWPVGALQYLTTWPSGQPQPFVSTLNAYNGGLVANAAIVPAGTNGAISVFVTDKTEAIIDINGYFAPPGNPGALFFYPITPCRVADTRSYGGKSGAFGPPQMSGMSTRSFALASSSCNVPPGAQAYSLNVTAWPGGPLGFLSAWPTGQAQPLVSTLNSLTGRVVPNAAIVPAGANGAISLFVTDPTDIFIDINGYFAP